MMITDLRIQELLPFPHGHHYWFTADPHFAHRRIMEHCNRPFATAEEMDESMLQGINERVGVNHTFFIIGDFGSWYDFPEGVNDVVENFRYYRERIQCKNVILVCGNHDPHYSNYMPKIELSGIFTSVAPIWMVKADGVRIWLSHYSHRTWPSCHRQFNHQDHSRPRSPRPCWHLYGHSHGNLPDDPHSLSFDVGMDCHGFKPLNLNDVAEIMMTKDWIDPHKQNAYAIDETE